MTVTTVAPLWESTPEVTPLKGGILSHANPVEGIGWQNPRGLTLSYNCLETNVPTELCPEPTTTKKFEAPGLIEGFEFAVYGGLICKPFGFDEETGKREIARVFGLKESRGVERALMETRFVRGPDDDAGAGTDYRWDPATDITPTTGAVPAKVGLALLEGYAASIYPGQPTLHLPYTVGSFLAADTTLVEEGGKFYTHLGAKVAVGPGYDFPNSSPAGVEATNGERWLYATGEVLVARSSLITNVQQDRSTNDIYALAERRYVAAIDCFAAAIRVSVE